MKTLLQTLENNQLMAFLENKDVTLLRKTCPAFYNRLSNNFPWNKVANRSLCSVEIPPKIKCHDMVLSPDRSRLAVIKRDADGTGQCLSIFNFKTQIWQKHELQNNHTFYSKPYISPDNSFLVMASNRTYTLFPYDMHEPVYDDRNIEIWSLDGDLRRVCSKEIDVYSWPRSFNFTTSRQFTIETEHNLLFFTLTDSGKILTNTNYGAIPS